MTPESKRIKIAELCGWIILTPEKHVGITYLWGHLKESVDRRVIPNYLSDLNDCAAFEATLTVDQSVEYWFNLFCCVTGFKREEIDPNNEYSCAEVISATAAQRCDAFLLTHNIDPDK